jgi:hypothetical protein
MKDAVIPGSRPYGMMAPCLLLVLLLSIVSIAAFT